MKRRLALEQRPLPLHRLRQVAVEASTDPRTVERVLRGKPTRGLQRERIELALIKLGIPLPGEGR
jgi:hypothetical protein